MIRTVTAAALIAAAAELSHQSPLGAQNARPPVRATIARAEWLAGTSVGKMGPVSLEERWTPPAGGAMLGVSRTIKGGKMVAFEFLRISEKDGGLVYIAQPNGRPPTEFALTEADDNSLTFENPAHDFPKMIRYARRPDGTLEARISDGAEKGETFLFRREP
jgi:Domain of unknown function (DUF6265)